MFNTPTTLAGLSLLLPEDDTEHDCVAMEESSEDLADDEAGPMIDNNTGSNTSPWYRPNNTVKQKTWNKILNQIIVNIKTQINWRLRPRNLAVH